MKRMIVGSLAIASLISVAPSSQVFAAETTQKVHKKETKKKSVERIGGGAAAGAVAGALIGGGKGAAIGAAAGGGAGTAYDVHKKHQAKKNGEQ